MRTNASNIDALLRSSVWRPSCESYWQPLDSSKTSLPLPIDYATDLECEHLSVDSRFNAGRLKLAGCSSNRFSEMGHGKGCCLTAYVLSPDNANTAIEIKNNILTATLCQGGSYVQYHLVTANVAKDDKDVFFLVQIDRSGTKAAGDIMSIFQAQLPRGSHIFSKSPNVMKGHCLGLRDNEIDPETKELKVKEGEAPQFVSNDVTSAVYFEPDVKEGLKGEDQVPSMTRTESKATIAESRGS